MATTPAASSPSVSSRMRKQRTRDTAAEMALRRELHLRGLRYRLHVAVLPRRTVDIVFTRARVAVDVRGCWWHACPVHATVAKANSEWWAAKISKNVERDEDTVARLSADGWEVVVVFECEPADTAADRVAEVVARSRENPAALRDLAQLSARLGTSKPRLKGGHRSRPSSPTSSISVS